MIREQDVRDEINVDANGDMTAFITATPYATVYGTLKIPKGTKDVDTYIEDHFDDIDFGEPDLDFAGADIEFEIR